MLLQALRGDGDTERPALSVRVQMVVLVPLLQQFILEGRATEGSGHDTKQVCRSGDLTRCVHLQCRARYFDIFCMIDVSGQGSC